MITTMLRNNGQPLWHIIRRQVSCRDTTAMVVGDHALAEQQSDLIARFPIDLLHSAFHGKHRLLSFIYIDAIYSSICIYLHQSDRKRNLTPNIKKTSLFSTGAVDTSSDVVEAGLIVVCINDRRM